MRGGDWRRLGPYADPMAVESPRPGRSTFEGGKTTSKGNRRWRSNGGFVRDQSRNQLISPFLPLSICLSRSLALSLSISQSLTCALFFSLPLSLYLSFPLSPFIYIYISLFLSLALARFKKTLSRHPQFSCHRATERNRFYPQDSRRAKSPTNLLLHASLIMVGDGGPSDRDQTVENMAHIRQSRPDSGVGFKTNVLQNSSCCHFQGWRWGAWPLRRDRRVSDSKRFGLVINVLIWPSNVSIRLKRSDLALKTDSCVPIPGLAIEAPGASKRPASLVDKAGHSPLTIQALPWHTDFPVKRLQVYLAHKIQHLPLGPP